MPEQIKGILIPAIIIIVIVVIMFAAGYQGLMHKESCASQETGNFGGILCPY